VIVGSDVEELPLAFDQRHALDFALLGGEAAGNVDARWSFALTGGARSGYPLTRQAAAGDTLLSFDGYLPWTTTVDLRLSWSPGVRVVCASCEWRLVADARNLLGRENILALRPGSGRLAPSADALADVQASVPRPDGSIPSESPLYRVSIDADRDGTITLSEFDAARLAAALDRFDPSLMLGAPRSIRLGIEVTF
jgi:hypothetical protein